MKKQYFILFILSGLALHSWAQNVTFTDPNFKLALLNHFPKVDTNGDGNISLLEANEVTRLNVNNKNISNLEGIEFFRNLEILDCSDNTRLKKINTENLTKLRFLTARNCDIKVIDVRNCRLWGLRLEGNPIEYAYLTGASTFQIEASFGIAFDLGSIKYVCISQAQYEPQANNVSHQGFWDRIGNALHIGQCTIATEICEIINFVDPNFKQALLNHSPVIDTDGDGEICVTEAEAALLIVATNKNIRNTSGIEYFKNIHTLNLSKNDFTHIDLSQNNRLAIIRLSRNKLKRLDLYNHPELRHLTAMSSGEIEEINILNSPVLWNLQVHNNKLSKLNLAGASLLYNLEVPFNNLTQVDLSSNTELWTLNISNNPLSDIDLSANTKLEFVRLNNTDIKSIDIRSIQELKKLSAENNLKLEKAYLSGNHSFYLNFPNHLKLRNCPNLNFVCVESAYLFQSRTYIQNTLGYVNCTVSTNCDTTTTNPSDFSYNFSLTPNPVENVATLEVKRDQVVPSEATIVNLAGGIEKRFSLTGNTISNPFSLGGNDVLIGDGIYGLLMGDIPAGQYIIIVETNMGAFSESFIKL